MSQTFHASNKRAAEIKKTLDLMERAAMEAPPLPRLTRYPIFAPNFAKKTRKPFNDVIYFSDPPAGGVTPEIPGGVSIEQCVTGKGLRNPDEPAFSGDFHMLTIAFMWPGYNTSDCITTIPSHYQSDGSMLPITRKQLLCHIGLNVIKLFKTFYNRPCSDPLWQMSDDNIRLEYVRVADIHRLDGEDQVWQVQMVAEVMGGLPIHHARAKTAMLELLLQNYEKENSNTG